MEKVKVPRVTDAKRIKVETGCGNAYVTVSYLGGTVVECFMHLGKAGGCAIAQGEALLRSISIGLRYGVPVEEYVKQLSGIGCPKQVWDNGELITSCPDAISRVLKRFHVWPGLGGVEETNKGDEQEKAEAAIQELARRREEQGL